MIGCLLATRGVVIGCWTVPIDSLRPILHIGTPMKDMKKAVIRIIFVPIIGESCYSTFLRTQPPYSWRRVYVKLLQVAEDRVQHISMRSNLIDSICGHFYNLEKLHHLHIVYQWEFNYHHRKF